MDFILCSLQVNEIQVIFVNKLELYLKKNKTFKCVLFHSHDYFLEKKILLLKCNLNNSVRND